MPESCKTEVSGRSMKLLKRKIMDIAVWLEVNVIRRV